MKLDDLKNKAQQAAAQHADKIKDGLEKAGRMADQKTGGKHSSKINQGLAKAKGAIDKLGQEGGAPPPPPPPPPAGPPPT